MELSRQNRMHAYYVQEHDLFKSLCCTNNKLCFQLQVESCSSNQFFCNAVYECLLELLHDIGKYLIEKLSC